MPVIQTERLRGAALEWATALAEGHIAARESWLFAASLVEILEGSYHPVSSAAFVLNKLTSGEVTSIDRIESDLYSVSDRDSRNCLGSTPGEAVCRLIVRNQFGSTLQVPDDVYEYQVNLEKVQTSVPEGENHG